MCGRGRLGSCGLALAACAAGCLAAPPSAQGPSDCAEIIRNRFDDTDVWGTYGDPGAMVFLEPDQAHIIVDASELGEGYAELYSETEVMLAGTEMTALVSVAQSAGAIVGIAWIRDTGDVSTTDYYDLAVSNGELEAIRKESGGEDEVLCAPECPEYDPIAHARLRLREENGMVHFQAAPVDGAWVDVQTAPASDSEYSALAFVFAGSFSVGDMTVDSMEWIDCEPSIATADVRGAGRAGGRP